MAGGAGGAVGGAALLLGGNYDGAADGINALLGISAAESDGALTLTADEAGAGSGSAG